MTYYKWVGLKRQTELLSSRNYYLHMKINYFFLALCSTATLLSSCGPKLQLTKEITYKSFKAEFKPNEIAHEIDKGLNLTINPIDAKEINDELLKASNLDGNFSKEEVTSYYKVLNGIDGAVKLGKKQRQTLTKIFDQIDKLQAKGQISKDQSVAYKEKVYTHFILIDYDYGYDGSEVEIYSEGTRATANPYFRNGKYLSVYKLSFVNSENQIKEVKSDDFQVLSESELLYPFKNAYFETLYKDEQEKLKTIYRINMPDMIRVIKNQHVSKYFSTPPINPNNRKLVVNYIKDGKVKEYAFDIHTMEQTNVINLDRYMIKFKKFDPSPKFNIIETNEYSIPLKGQHVYINRAEISNEFILKTLSVNWIDGKVSLFSKTFKPGEVQKKVITVTK